MIDSLAYLFRFTDPKESSSMRANIMNVLQSNLFKITKENKIAVIIKMNIMIFSFWKPRIY